MPRISVIVRSYNRLAALCELLTKLLAQQHDSFEIVVVEQSTQRDDADVAALDVIASDPRVRILRFKPLGGPGARNAGVRNATGELFVFIDDDDLPFGTDWLTLHEANFAAANCLGVTGKFIDENGEAKPYANQERARRNVLSFNWLKWQRVYTRTDQKKKVDSLMGGNVAIPRTTLERFGLWDECTPIEDEPSLAYRILAGKRADEYMLFDPAAKMIRRLDVPGGMAKRTLSGPAYAKKVFTFLHNVTAHYFPLRFVALYPAYYGLVATRVIDWIWDDSKRHDTLGKRVVGTLGFLAVLPPLWCVWLAQLIASRITKGAPRHCPRLDDADVPQPYSRAVKPAVSNVGS